jgi:purine-binding chemotaxis protein CheW
MREPFIIFTVAGAAYAVRSEQVLQVGMIENVTRVPNAPPYVDGVQYIRGQVVPVINLRARFGMERAAYDRLSRLVVITLGKRILGLAVDSAREFLYLETDEITPPPETVVGPGVEYLEGVISLNERLILVVNLGDLFNRQEREQLEAHTLERE